MDGVCRFQDSSPDSQEVADSTDNHGRSQSGSEGGSSQSESQVRTRPLYSAKSARVRSLPEIEWDMLIPHLIV